MSWLTSISVQTQGSAMHYLGGETCLVICLFYDTKWGNIISEGTGDFMILLVLAQGRRKLPKSG
jgi:hypothetical protein